MNQQLSATTAIGRAVAAVKMTELLMLAALKPDAWNCTPGIMWLARNPHPMFYRCYMGDTGRVHIDCEPGLVGTRLFYPGQRALLDAAAGLPPGE